jgi:flagellar motility protein MotE (MotC chaperone)
MDNLLDEQKQESKKYNKIQWFFVVIVIPSIFAFMVAAIVASFAGVDVWGKTKELSDKIPFVATDKEKVAQQKVEEMEKRVTELNTEIQFRDDTITELETEMDGKEREIQNLTLEKEQLEMQMDELRNVGDSVNEPQTMSEIIRTFENMSAKKAAPIIESMNENNALTILSSLKSDTLAGLLENMSPDVAAKFTTLLTNNSREE